MAIQTAIHVLSLQKMLVLGSSQLWESGMDMLVHTMAPFQMDRLSNPLKSKWKFQISNVEHTAVYIKDICTVFSITCCMFLVSSQGSRVTKAPVTK